MKTAPRVPLLAKALCWLGLHLLILALSFFAFVRWQLGFGLDSLLSGSAGARLVEFGDQVLAEIVDLPRDQWSETISRSASRRGLAAGLWFPRGEVLFPVAVPPNVEARARGAMPPRDENPAPHLGRPPGPDGLRPSRPMPPPGREREDFRPPEQMEPPLHGNESSVFLPKSRPVFLLRGENGDGYWAGVLLHFPPLAQMPRRPALLLIRADSLDGSGMFFDFKPWLLGGLAVLSLSIAFWTPFVWNITRYVRLLTSAADQISAGRFHPAIPSRGNDELGELGRTIEAMAARLDHLVSGQKRFLGDAAHELCAPLARIRTGLGILENRVATTDAASLASIESDVAELAALVNEILAFSRAGNSKPSMREVNLTEIVQSAIRRESPDIGLTLSIASDLTASADPALLGRAVGNLIRNAGIHAGPRAVVSITAEPAGDHVHLTVADNGPGVPQEELARIFEPFYRLDRSRSRDTGGSGLGLSIVRAAVQACGGEVSASPSPGGGLAVTLRLPAKVRET
jgi:two-component system, OmpR family, sensor histidine kinase CpxA